MGPSRLCRGTEIPRWPPIPGLDVARTYPNCASATHGYDAGNRLTRLDNRQNSALVASWAYAYDANGNRTEQVETNGGAPETTSYTYDAADRLIEVAYPEKTVATTLDPVGNRLTEVTTDASHAPTSAKTYAYDIRDRLLSIVDSVAPTNNATFTWDANGNQIGKSAGGVQHGFLFDALDRLVEVQRNGLLLERYTFDPSGYRIRKAGPDGIFRYVRDDGAILQQTDDAGTTLVRYEWGGDRLVAMHPATGQRSFSLFDGLGSLTAWSQTDGSLSLRRSFDAWGNLRHSTGTTLAPFAFTGHELDAATGLTYAKARFLDTEVGRFLSEDPILGEANTPPSLHRYLYAYGNPTLYWDRSGMAAEEAPCTLPASLCTPKVEVDENSGEIVTAGRGSKPPGAVANPGVEEDKPWWEEVRDWAAERFGGRVKKVEKKGGEFSQVFDESTAKPASSADEDQTHAELERQRRKSVEGVKVVVEKGTDAGVEVVEQTAETYLDVESGKAGLNLAGELVALVKGGATKIVRKEAVVGLETDGWKVAADDAGTLRSAVPRSPSQAARNSVQGEYLDPFTNQTVSTGERLSADHFVPQKVIKELPGFSELTKEQQRTVLNYKSNLQGLPGPLNSSKGATLPSQWTRAKGRELSPEYVRNGREKEQQVLRELQALIKSLAGGGK